MYGFGDPYESELPLQVNPPTAYNMLHDYVQLDEGDWIVQNGANSAVCQLSALERSFQCLWAQVGQAVIQIAAARGWKTLNFIRNR